MTFAVLDVTRWEVAGQEQEGATEHPWLRHPEENELYLWKPARGRREARKEHWAEKIASELARLLGLPCAAVELGIRQEADETIAGCLSRNLQGHGYEMHSGAVLLSGLDPDFDPHVREQASYRVDNIVSVLADVVAPQGQVANGLPSEFTAFEVFAGYLTFDALLLNRDRHAANWSILRRRDSTEPDQLCALYDNASALSLSLSDRSRTNRLDSKGVQAYAVKEDYARSFPRRGGKPARLIDVAGEALTRCSTLARGHWLTRVGSLTSDALLGILDAIPEMSDPLRTFTVELLRINQERIARALEA